MNDASRGKRSVKTNAYLVAGPIAAIVTGLACSAAGLENAVCITLAITAWCATWWMLEPVHGAVTALIPLAALPTLGILTPKQVAEAYGNELILLLGGGFMLSTAMERTGAHRRLALAMVRAFGGKDGKRIVYGFAAASALVSMWISNTATTLMLLPVALAIIETYPDQRLAAPLVLAIAYAASIGGLGTPIGTPPNLVFMQVYEQTTGTRMGFVEWMTFGVPVVAIFAPIAALWLARGLGGSPPAVLPHPGPWSAAERRVLTVFALVALAWVTRTEPFGGWSTWFGLPGANDASVALFGVIALCLVPDGRGERLLTWQAAERIPWGALVLFGGGIAIATAFQVSGLSDLVAAKLGGFSGASVLAMTFAICLGVALLSEIASNTATAVLLMPILAATGVANGIDPALLMVPAVLAASCGFMLPVATAPNLIAYGTGFADSRRMIREGAVLDLVGVFVLTGVCYSVFG